MLSGSRNSRMYIIPMSLTGSWPMPRPSRCSAAASNSALSFDTEREVVEAGAVLVERVGRPGAQPDARIARPVDDTAEQEPELFTRCVVGVLGHLEGDRPAEHILVEPPRPLDVGDGEPDVRDGRGVDRHGAIVPAAPKTLCGGARTLPSFVVMSATVVRGQNVDIRMWTRPQEVEPSAMQQLQNIAALPWAVKHVAVMPDVHFGKGATVGSVIALRDAVSPAAVGVDIGCGMAAVRTSLTANDLPDSLRRLRTRLEAVVPVGFAQHGEPAFTDDDANDWTSFWKMFDDLTPVVKARADKALRQLGSLGCRATTSSSSAWTPGRPSLADAALGVAQRRQDPLAELHIAAARKLPHNSGLPDRDLAVFLVGTPEMTAYQGDLTWAQTYARRNRDTMLRAGT